MAVWLVSFLRLPIFNSILTWGKIGDIILKKKFMGYNDNVRVHYSDVIMSTMVSQITGVSIVYSTVCSGADQRKHHWPLWGEFTAQISHKMGNQMKSWFTYRVNKFIWKILAEMTYANDTFTIPEDAMLWLFWKIGESKWNPCWVNVLTSSSGANYVVHKHEDFGQYSPTK